MVRKSRAYLVSILLAANSRLARLAGSFFIAHCCRADPRVHQFARSHISEVACCATQCIKVAAAAGTPCGCHPWLFLVATHRCGQKSRNSVRRLLEFEILCWTAKCFHLPATGAVAGLLLRSPEMAAWRAAFAGCFCGSG